MNTIRPKAKFCLCTTQNGWMKCPPELKPKAVKLPDRCPKWMTKYEFFTHREYMSALDDSWCMSEVTTGQAVTKGWATRGQAEAAGIEKLKNNGMRKVREALKNGIDNANKMFDEHVDMRPQCDAYRWPVMTYGIPDLNRCENKATFFVTAKQYGKEAAAWYTCDKCYEQAVKPESCITIVVAERL